MSEHEQALTDEKLDEGLALFQNLEESIGWKAAVATMLVFDPLPERVQQIKDHADGRATEFRVEGNAGEERRFLETSETLSILAEKAARARGRRTGGTAT